MAAETPEDIQVLPVAFDSADERFRSYDSAFNSYTEDDLADWPIDGPRSVYAVLKQLWRDDRNLLQQHDDWVLRSQVDSSNRAMHEHRALSRALHFGVSYDQPCMPNLAAAEVLVKRRMLIEQPHSGGRSPIPVYEASDLFMGVLESVDGSVVDLSAVRYTVAYGVRDPQATAFLSSRAARSRIAKS